MNHVSSAQAAVRVFLENMVGEALLAHRVGLDAAPGQIVDASIGQIMRLIDESLPLARLLDASDLLFHAEGPGATHDLPWLSALTWLTGTVEHNLRRLCAAALDLLGADGKPLARKLDLRLTGVAPGSLWIGTRLQPPPADMLPVDDQMVPRLVDAMARLPALIGFIDDEGLLPGIAEAVPDPALRDAALFALLGLAPTGNRGIHTLEISSSTYGSASLSQRERVVLRNVLRQPMSDTPCHGTFVGEVRAADLDKTRFHLRTADSTLRCVIPDLCAEQARVMLGRHVQVTGRYESDRDGRPRLLLVERIETLPEPQSLL